MHTEVSMGAGREVNRMGSCGWVNRTVRVAGIGALLLIAWLGWQGWNRPFGEGAADSAATLVAGLEPALVPTLGQWGLLLLALALMGVAFLVMRRNSPRGGRGR